MFTVKLYRRIADGHRGGDPQTDGSSRPIVFSTKIVQGLEVDVHQLRPNELVEVAVRHDNEGHNTAFYVAPSGRPRPEGFADEIEFYYAAYIENAHGATTEVVKF